MGFYGNITNTSNTTFSFDRIYSNKREMDSNVNNDGIFIGRYVLVEYDQDAAYPVVFMNKKTNKFYSSKNFDQATEIRYIYGDKSDEYILTIDTRVISGKQYYKLENDKYINVSLNSNDNPSALGLYEYVGTSDGVYDKEIVQVQEVTSDEKTGNLITIFIGFYQCEGAYDGKHAQFKQLDKDPNSEKSNYIKNFAIDEKHLNGEQQKSFKGYDSTVWMKSSVEQNGKLITKYVNIADLNSVVPTFDIAADAPTMTPITPHFDADSTNVYYKLHAQPQWGFRIAKADGNTGTRYTSDADTQWTKIDYNISTDETNTLYASGVDDNKVPIWNGNSISTIPAAIFYNARAFEKQIGETSIDKYSKDITEDKIEITTGKSGNEYNLHNGKQGPDKGVQDDTQELTIHLPSIGNMMSDAWDIIHGPLRNNDMRQYLTNEEGKMLDKDGNITEDESKAVKVDSLQGRLNSIAAIEKNQIPIKRINNGQLVGTKINGDKHSTITDNFDASVIKDDFTQDDAWIKTQVNADNTPNAISIHHTFNSTPNSTSQVNKNDNTKNQGGENYKEVYLEDRTNVVEEHQDKIKLYVPYVDAAGHVVGENIETITLPYGYKTFTTNGLGKDEKGKEIVTDLHTKITISEDGANTSFSEAAPTQTIANNTQDSMAIEPYNKWIQTKLTNDKLVIAHEIHAINTEKNTTDLNDLKDNKIQNEINIPDWDYDAAGHIKKKGEHTYTLPYGYKTISTNGRYNNETINTEEFDSEGKAITKRNNIVADSTQDTLVINSGNKWIRIDTDATNDILTISHDIHNIPNSDNNNVDLNDSNKYYLMTNGNTINIPDWEYDEAGHIKNKHNRNYTLPYGYKTIKITNNPNSTGLHSVANGNLIARNTKDSLELIAENNWIAMEAISDSEIGNRIYIGHKTNGNTFGKTYYSNIDNSNSVDTHNRNPKFGDSFNIFNLTTDNAGHLTGIQTNSIKIPGLSLTNGASGNIVTGINYQYDINNHIGKFTEIKENVGALTLGGYAQGTIATDIVETDTINSAFAKLQNQIKNVYGSEKIAQDFDTIKEIADWLDANDSNADKIIDGIAKLNGDNTVEGSVAHSIETAIDRLKVDDTVITGQYVSAVSEANGKISVSRASLPTYTLATGTTNGTVEFNGEEVAVRGLGSAAYKDKGSFATSEQGKKADTAIQLDTEFAYKIQKDDGEGNIVEEELKTTIQEMAKEIANLKQILKDNGLITE